MMLISLVTCCFSLRIPWVRDQVTFVATLFGVAV